MNFTPGLPRDWIPTLVRLLGHEPIIARVVVTESRGSTPREPGAFMLVGRDSVEGSIGGGRLEWEAIAAARDLLAAPDIPARISKVTLAADVGQCCGGVVSIWLDRFTRDDLPLLRSATEAGAQGPAVLVSEVVAGAGVMHRRLMRYEPPPRTQPTRVLISSGHIDAAVDHLLRKARQHAQPVVVTCGMITAPNLAFIERLDDPLPAVWLYGAGHVGQALARILMELPLRLTWIDSRAGLFPQTLPNTVRTLPQPDSVATVSDAPVGTYFIVMSHSHPLDFELCHALLERNDFAWLGLIGSDSKAARFRSRLARAGLGPEVIAKLVCPIGVAGITSKWPAAIAVAVAAQLMQMISSAAEQSEVALPAVPPCRSQPCRSQPCRSPCPRSPRSAPPRSARPAGPPPRYPTTPPEPTPDPTG